MKKGIIFIIALIVLLVVSNNVEAFSDPYYDYIEYKGKIAGEQFEKSYNTVDIPEIDTSFKSYMDYTFITNKNSVQYRIQKRAVTDEQGIRTVGDDVCVAVGSGIAQKCGQRLLFTLDTGVSFTAIVADLKDDAHTDPTNKFTHVYDDYYNMIEFIVETSKLDKFVRTMGNIGEYEKYSGNITSIQIIEGSEWES